MATARVIGSGPNGLAGAITLQRAGVATTVFERNARLGGGLSTGEVTLPGFRHDLGSSVYPMGKASPFFKGLPFEIPWVEPDAPCAHPLDDGTAVMLEHSIAATAEGLDRADRASYRRLMEPIAAHFEELVEDFLAPMLHVPTHPLLMARFGVWGALPATTLAGLRFKGARAQALFGGMAAHSVQALDSPMSAAVGLVLMAAGHTGGWPILRGGAQSLTDLMVGYLGELGGRVEASREILDLGGEGFDSRAVSERQLKAVSKGFDSRAVSEGQLKAVSKGFDSRAVSERQLKAVSKGFDSRAVGERQLKAVSKGFDSRAVSERQLKAVSKGFDSRAVSERQLGAVRKNFDSRAVAADGEGPGM